MKIIFFKIYKANKKTLLYKYENTFVCWGLASL